MIRFPPLTLFLYFALSYLRYVVYCLLSLTAFVALLDVVELMRRVGETQLDVGTAFIVGTSFTNLPNLFDQMLPFGVFGGSIVCFYFWTKNHEFVTARSFGQNIWQALTPVFVVTLLIGFFQIIVMSPVISTMSNQYEAQMDQLFNSRAQANLSISENGVWLRDRIDNQTVIIHGQKLDAENARITDAILFTIAENGILLNRISADEMQLIEKQWRISQATRIANDGTSEILGDIGKKSILDKRSLSLTIRPPHTINVFGLPNFISLLKDAGLAPETYQVHFHQLLSTPLKLLGLVMLAASLTVTQFSRKQRLRLVVLALASSFGFYFTSDLIFVLGNSSHLPYYVAGWAPALLILSIGAVLLARVEEH